MIAHIVTACAECPYAWIGGDVQPWVCTAEEPGRVLGKSRHGVMWLDCERCSTRRNA